MTSLELLAPAKNKEIGIAAIDCGADAVYIGAPSFGARVAAGNSVEDIAELCAYAHRYGARVFVTFNTTVGAGELDALHSLMLATQNAGADAFIIRDPSCVQWADITVPLHASTQCAIRSVERAQLFESLGCSRIILERQLSLQDVKGIADAVQCEVEFFVHGAICTGYSGECRLSEYLDGRSADKGACIQACRSLYDLVDASGRTLVRGKALLSLKDYNLRERLEDLASAGVSSFKIEGRLKNISYVRNVVRDYSLALDALVQRFPEQYCRASFGRVTGGFVPDTLKTFNRGYTQLWLDGKRGNWSSMDAPKSMGEPVGEVKDVLRIGRDALEIRVGTIRGVELHNGDGFAFVGREGIIGFRGDVCSQGSIRCKDVPQLRKGVKLFRNIDSAFEKTMEARPCKREIPVDLQLRIRGKYVLELHALTQDGREILSTFNTDVDTAENTERAAAMLREQLGKRSGIYNFTLSSLDVDTAGGKLPLLSASTINSIRRLIAEDIDGCACNARPLLSVPRPGFAALPATESRDDTLMRSRYCVRYELGMCPVHQGAKPSGPLFLLNNGRKLALHFDCSACEMSVTPVQN